MFSKRTVWFYEIRVHDFIVATMRGAIKPYIGYVTDITESGLKIEGYSCYFFHSAYDFELVYEQDCDLGI